VNAPQTDIQAWLETIDDEQERQAVVAALDIVEPLMIEDDEDDVFTPFVYPH